MLYRLKYRDIWVAIRYAYRGAMYRDASMHRCIVTPLVLSTWFGDICGSRKDLYVLQKFTITLFQILYVAAAYAKTNVTSRACEAAYRNALAILAVATLLGGIELLLLIYAVRVCRLPSLLAILLLDTLCSKKWYDMPHIGYGIHSHQWSTIPRIGRHSAVYN